MGLFVNGSNITLRAATSVVPLLSTASSGSPILPVASALVVTLIKGGRLPEAEFVGKLLAEITAKASKFSHRLDSESVTKTYQSPPLS